MYDKFHHVPGLDIQEKALGPAVPYIFRFSCQQKYFSEKHEKAVTSEEKLIALATPGLATSNSVY